MYAYTVTVAAQHRVSHITPSMHIPTCVHFHLTFNMDKKRSIQCVPLPPHTASFSLIYTMISGSKPVTIQL